MLVRVIGTTLARVVSSTGWVLLGVGLLVACSPVLDALAGKRAVATVIELRDTCRQQIVTSTGSKRWRKITCDRAGEIRAAGIPVRSKSQVRLAFPGVDGRPRSAWTSLATLGLKNASVGQQVAVSYRGDRRPTIASPFKFNAWVVSGGLSVSFTGLMLLAFARKVKRITGGLSKSQPAAAVRDLASLLDLLERMQVPRPPQAPKRQIPTRPTGRSARASERAPRRGVIQRNRGLFERLFS